MAPREPVGDTCVPDADREPAGCRRQQRMPVRMMHCGLSLTGASTCMALASCHPTNTISSGLTWCVPQEEGLDRLLRPGLMLGFLPVLDKRSVRRQHSQLSRRGFRVMQIVA